MPKHGTASVYRQTEKKEKYSPLQNYDQKLEAELHRVVDVLISS